ncbi:MAG: hypothetical protein U1E62_10760 [Alsobacter sp.]
MPQPTWTVDLGRLEAHSSEADVSFRWTDDDQPEVYLLRPRRDGMTEADASTLAQAAKRAIATHRSQAGPRRPAGEAAAP